MDKSILHGRKKYLVDVVGDAAEEAVTNEYMIISDVILKKRLF